LVVQLIAAAADPQDLAVHKRLCQLAAGAFINAGHRGAGDAHAPRAFFLRQLFPIHQADALVFIECHDDRFRLPAILRREAPIVGIALYAAASWCSGHSRPPYFDI